MSDLTPMMQQYQEIKDRYEDCILFFRMGDFYEMFNGDAETAARVLDIALTSRNKGGGKETPMAGVPAHSAASYIADLIDNDFKVAICEQLEDPDQASGLVDRDVIRIITPGTVIENELLDDKKNNYLAAMVTHNESVGFSYIDISTGEFFVTEFPEKNREKVWDEIDRIQPREVISSLEFRGHEIYENLKRQYGFLENNPDDLMRQKAYNKLLHHFETQSLAGFGCEEMEAGIVAAGQIISFLEETQKRVLAHIDQLTSYNLQEFMVLDSATRRNLELTSTIRDQKVAGSLLSIVDQTITSMGGRLIKKWLNQPLIDKNEIDHRLEAVSELVNNYDLLQELREDLDGIYDLERILGKITYESATARDLAFLRQSLRRLPGLKDDLANLESSLFVKLEDEFDSLTDLEQLLAEAIVDDPPTSVREGGLIRSNFDKELDQLRSSRSEGKDWITNLQKTERERTGINSLKVGFNKVFGYYIEVTKANLDKVPDDYERKQTLTNSERYIIPELKEKEAQVLGAEEKINELEYELFVEVRDQIAENIERIKQTAQMISRTDVLLSLASVALAHDYVCPQISEGNEINIKDGRHPVVEDMQDEVFVPNDTLLDHKENRFLIITGPNMSGKSTYMRQVALIVLLAQIGSFVPAKEAEIGIVDRIFTRVGASDDLTTGQSTFMIEMNEVANIVNNATDQSLIILDEVGRGTSTYDGLSIAWAVSEYINAPENIGARSLFATHYHELTRLENEYSGIKNYNVLVEEDEKGVHFLYKIVPGSADQSYGIEVARLAGLPEEIIINAQRILNHLETKASKPEVQPEQTEGIKEVVSVKENEGSKEDNKGEMKTEGQMQLFNPLDPVVEEIKNKEIVNMTPLEALNFLHQLKQEIKQKGEKNG
ncbi:MAG: DNA mismatch repair protein MutS [Halanaerobiaceae bacterium]